MPSPFFALWFAIEFFYHRTITQHPRRHALSIRGDTKLFAPCFIEA